MNSKADSQINSYLNALRECLSNMSAGDREEIVREISAHIRERAQEPGSSIDTILERLGSARDLASQYGEDLVIRHASRSVSPLLILRATLHLAKRSMEGIVLFLGALIGYVLGAGLVITGLLKPIFPRETGLWIGPGVFDFGLHEPRYTDPVHEVLGWWYIPIALGLGCFFLWLTTSGIRRFLRRSKGRGPIFPRRQAGIPTIDGLFIMLAFFLAAINLGNTATRSILTEFPPITSTRVEAPMDSGHRLLLLVNITRTSAGRLHVHLDLSREQ